MGVGSISLIIVRGRLLGVIRGNRDRVRVGLDSQSGFVLKGGVWLAKRRAV